MKVNQDVWVVQQTLSGTAAQVASANRHASNVTIKNVDASITIYVGAAGVTSATGFALAAGESISFPNFSLRAGGLYAVAASGTPVIHIIGSC